MNSLELKVKMLNGFSMSIGENTISYNEDRSKKSWLLLAYLITKRNRPVPIEELTRIVWEDDTSQSAIKTMIHRTRTLLDGLGEGAGHEILLAKDGSYCINPGIDVTVDAEEFYSVCIAGRSSHESAEKLELFLKALSMYSGDFLPMFSAEHWVISIQIYFHDEFMHATLEAAGLLDAEGKRTEAAEICRRALLIEPYSEPVYLSLMRNLYELGDKDGVIAAYGKMSTQLYFSVGALPSEEATAIYRMASSSFDEHPMPWDVLAGRLREIQESRGAYVCDYDMLKVIYQIEARRLVRTGIDYHVVLFSISSKNLKKAMADFLETLRSGIRAGDVISTCSASQYIVLLPSAKKDDAVKICERVSATFFRNFPHSSARIDYDVIPVEPKRFAEQG